MFPSTFLSFLLVASAGTSLSKPLYPRFTVGQDHFEVLALRWSMELDPSAVTDVQCMNPDLHIVFHDQNIAELAICGGISGEATRCEGAPTRTAGESRSARFALRATEEDAGATINITKARWEKCIRAARAVCPTGSMRATCVGGASKGDVHFVLDSPGSSATEL